MICSDGNTYERREIMQWLSNHDTSPKTNMILSNKLLIPNHAIKSGITKYLSTLTEAKKVRTMKVTNSLIFYPAKLCLTRLNCCFEHEK